MNYIFSHPFIFLATVISLLSIAAVIAWLDLRRKWNKLFGKKSETSAELLAEAMRRLNMAEEKIGVLEPRVDTLEAIGKVALQKVGFMRFNPFNDTGGDQSFAVALLDRENNGVVISSLYTREGVRTYAKYIENGAPKHPLSEEEKMVLRQALES